MVSDIGRPAQAAVRGPCVATAATSTINDVADACGLPQPVMAASKALRHGDVYARFLSSPPDHFALTVGVVIGSLAMRPAMTMLRKTVAAG